jgi:hypothetical protein
MAVLWGRHVRVCPCPKAHRGPSFSRRQEHQTPSPSRSPHQLLEPSPMRPSLRPSVPRPAAGLSISRLFLQRLQLPLRLPTPSRTRPCHPSLITSHPRLRRLPPPRLQPCPHSARSPPRADILLACSPSLDNSGFDANAGFFACVMQSGDALLYDEAIASVYDGARVSRIAAHMHRPFAHNDVRPRSVRFGPSG